MSSFFGRPSTAAAALPTTPESKDIELSDPSSDSISKISFSPTADYLAVGGWDNNVRVYEVQPTGQTAGKAMYSHEGPVLDICWNTEGNKIFSVGADNAGRQFDVQTGQTTQVAQHDQPIKCARWVETPSGGILATGSWDKTIKYWDLRQPNPVASLMLSDRVYTMDVVYPLLVAGTADRNIQAVNLHSPATVFRQIESPLKWQTRVISCFPAGNGFAVGSIEGRVAIQWLEEKDASLNYSFRCHRREVPNQKDQMLVFAINDITFHKQQGTFCTAGADGTIGIWDKDSHIRLKSFEAGPGPVTSTAFNHTGTILAYAISYDWSKGHTGMVANHPNKVMLHALKDEEVRRRARK